VRSADNWPELKWYQWVEASWLPAPEPVEALSDRFAGYLQGYSTFADEPETFSEWLRMLPLAALGTPVRNYRGEIVVPGDDEHLAAVVAIDIGSGDIQRSTDVILRLQAEWRWYREEFRMLFLTDEKTELPLLKWGDGERVVSVGGQPKWVRKAEPQVKIDYPHFRDYLDSVFAWSDSPALLAESDSLAPDRLEPGAFFLHQGPPAEVLVVIDVASSSSGDRQMLLAQALNPAENIHVIRPSRATPWFPVRTDQPVVVPRVKPYSWNELRRMKQLRTRPEVNCIGELCPKAQRSSRKPALPPRSVRR